MNEVPSPESVGRAILERLGVAEDPMTGADPVSFLRSLGAAGVALVKNPDVLQAIIAKRDPRTLVVGFKAETGDAVAEASRMLREKGLDLVVANDVTAKGSEFGGDTDQVTLVSADGVEALPLLSKRDVARRLVAKITERLAL